MQENDATSRTQSSHYFLFAILMHATLKTFLSTCLLVFVCIVVDNNLEHCLFGGIVDRFLSTYLFNAIYLAFICMVVNAILADLKMFLNTCLLVFVYIVVDNNLQHCLFGGIVDRFLSTYLFNAIQLAYICILVNANLKHYFDGIINTILRNFLLAFVCVVGFMFPLGVLAASQERYHVPDLYLKRSIGIFLVLLATSQQRCTMLVFLGGCAGLVGIAAPDSVVDVPGGHGSNGFVYRYTCIVAAAMYFCNL